MTTVVRIGLVLVAAIAGYMALSRLGRRTDGPGRIGIVAADVWTAVLFGAFGLATGDGLASAFISALIFGVLWSSFDIGRRVWRDEW